MPVTGDALAQIGVERRAAWPRYFDRLLALRGVHMAGTRQDHQRLNQMARWETSARRMRHQRGNACATVVSTKLWVRKRSNCSGGSIVRPPLMKMSRRNCCAKR